MLGPAGPGRILYVGASPARASFCEPHMGLCGGCILQRVSAWLPIPAHSRCSWSKRSRFQGTLAPSGRAARLWAHLAQGVPCLSFPSSSRNHPVPVAAAVGMPTRPCSQQAELWGCAGTERGRAHACARGSCLSCSVPAPGARGEARRLCRTPARAPRGAGPLPARRACTQQPARRRGSARRPGWAGSSGRTAQPEPQPGPTAGRRSEPRRLRERLCCQRHPPGSQCVPRLCLVAERTLKDLARSCPAMANEEEHPSALSDKQVKACGKLLPSAAAPAQASTPPCLGSFLSPKIWGGWRCVVGRCKGRWKLGLPCSKGAKPVQPRPGRLALAGAGVSRSCRSAPCCDSAVVLPVPPRQPHTTQPGSCSQQHGPERDAAPRHSPALGEGNRAPPRRAPLAAGFVPCGAGGPPATGQQ